MNTENDFEIENHGSVVLIRPMTENARAHAAETFPEDCPMHGNAYAVEPRYAPGIAADLYFEQGFAVTVDGLPCNADREAA